MMKKLIAFLLVLALLVPVGSALAVKYYRVSTSWLKAHEKPQASAAVVDSYRRDFAVAILSRNNSGWARVRFLPSGNTAYVQSKYLESCKSYTAYISKDNTLLREGPATSFKSKGKLNRGTKVTVLTHGHAFDYVSTPKGKGYIRNSCLTTAKTNGRTAHIKNPRNKTVNLRKGPGKNYKVLAEYRPGTKVTLLQKGKAWSKISVRGKTGYIMTKYLSLD
jgi:mannosyl-glycoprotein endo-beta-N-acetylglucosaminidase